MQDNEANLPQAAMSESAFALWGIDDVAYVKQVEIDGKPAWAIFAADGTALGATPDRDLAFATILQNDRNPVSVH
jgi:hypothetical protein